MKYLIVLTTVGFDGRWFDRQGAALI